MNKDLKNSNINFEEDSIDFVSLLKKIWHLRKLVIIVTLSFFFIGCITALLSPVVYTAQTTFVPQVSDENTSSTRKGLGSLASLAGINLNSIESTNDSYLSPLLYPKLAQSEEFSYKIINEEIINLNGDKFTIREYLLSDQNSFSFNPIATIKKYTIGLFLGKEKKYTENNIIKDYNYLSKIDYDLVRLFKNKFEVELNSDEGYVKVLAFDKSAFISAQLVEKITQNLQSKIIELRTSKIRERLEFSKEQYEIKQIEFDLLQKKLAEFKDSNKNISTARFRSELQKLDAEYQLQNSILINLASEYNNNKIKLNRDTPIFSIIEDVFVPNERSEPNRKTIALTFTFIGFIFSVLYIISKDQIIDIFRELKD